MYTLVSTFNNSFDNIWFEYFIPNHLLSKIKLWQFVEIPLKDKIEIAFIIDIYNESKISDSTKIKSIISIFNTNVFLNKNQINILIWISKNYFTLIHNSLGLFFPKNLIDKLKKNKLNLNSNKSFNYLYNNEIKLTKQQNEIYEKMLFSKNNLNYLYWITWSWKTEIYINLIYNNLKNNKQSLLLLPEIILNNQIFSRLKKVFWDDVLIINSSIKETQKTKNWIDIYNNKAKIIIWTRSSIFYPYNNLWIIIVDEEHDNSYFSDQTPRYSTIDLVKQITNLYWNKLVLASWTPSVKSMYEATNKKFNLVYLIEKYKKE